MTGRIIHTPTLASSCPTWQTCADIPSATTLLPGTRWQCDYCEQVWVVVEGSQYNEYYRAWRKLTNRNLNGDDK